MAKSGKVAKKLLVRHSSSNLSNCTIELGSSVKQLTSNLKQWQCLYVFASEDERDERGTCFSRDGWGGEFIGKGK